MYPELFHIGNFVVFSYGFFIMLGVLMAFLFFYFKRKKSICQSMILVNYFSGALLRFWLFFPALFSMLIVCANIKLVIDEVS